MPRALARISSKRGPTKRCTHQRAHGRFFWQTRRQRVCETMPSRDFWHTLAEGKKVFSSQARGAAARDVGFSHYFEVSGCPQASTQKRTVNECVLCVGGLLRVTTPQGSAGACTRRGGAACGGENQQHARTKPPTHQTLGGAVVAGAGRPTQQQKKHTTRRRPRAQGGRRPRRAATAHCAAGSSLGEAHALCWRASWDRWTDAAAVLYPRSLQAD